MIVYSSLLNTANDYTVSEKVGQTPCLWNESMFKKMKPDDRCFCSFKISLSLSALFEDDSQNRNLHGLRSVVFSPLRCGSNWQTPKTVKTIKTAREPRTWQQAEDTCRILLFHVCPHPTAVLSVSPRRLYLNAFSTWEMWDVANLSICAPVVPSSDWLPGSVCHGLHVNILIKVLKFWVAQRCAPLNSESLQRKGLMKLTIVWLKCVLSCLAYMSLEKLCQKKCQLDTTTPVNLHLIWTSVCIIYSASQKFLCHTCDACFKPVWKTAVVIWAQHLGW